VSDIDMCGTLKWDFIFGEKYFTREKRERGKR
jgi:hypothetical protein